MTSHSDPLRIGILGTGTMATALAEAWTRAGHEILVGGRRAAPPADVVAASDAVLLAVSWSGVDAMLDLAGPGLAGKPLIDCTNAVDFATGRLLPPSGSAAEHIAERSGAHVVKALHLFAGTSWLTDAGTPRTVAICGDDAAALALTERLIRDLGGTPATLGGLDRARQLEDVAGFVMGLVATGHDPATAVPAVQAA